MSRNPDAAWGPLASSRNTGTTVATPVRPAAQSAGGMANAARPVAVLASSGSANQASRYAEMMAALNAAVKEVDEDTAEGGPEDGPEGGMRED